MNEYSLQFIAAGKLLWAGVFSLLYGLGGIQKKWIRRYLGAAWMGGGVCLFGALQNSFSWLHLLYPALLCASLSLGYGGTDDTLVKIRKRAIYGLALGVAALPLCFGSGLWFLFGLHVALCVTSSVALGVSNPTKTARDEESLIAALSSILPLFLI